jgi:DHA2 family multidrug resistance protein-like MFS transporter
MATFASPNPVRAATVVQRRNWHALVACSVLQVAVLAQPQLWQMGLEIPVSAFNASGERYRAYMGFVAMVVMAFVLAGGVLGDLFGRRRVLLLGTISFVALNLVSLLANDLVTYAVLQTAVNCAGGLLMPLTFAYLRVLFTNAAARSQALLVYSATGILGAALPLLAILLSGWWGWRATLALPVVLAVAGGALAWRTLPASVAEGQISRSSAAISTSVALLMLGVMFGLVMGQLLTLGGLAITLLTVGVALVGGGILLFQGTVLRKDLTGEMLRRRQLIVLLLAVITISFGLMVFVMPLYGFFVNGYGWGYVSSGLGLAPVVLVFLFTFAMARRLVLRYPNRLLIVAGFGLMALAAALMTIVLLESPYLPLVVPMAIFGFGYLLAQTAWSSMYLRVLPEELVGVSAAISKAAGRIGGTLAGIVAASTLLSFGQPDLARRMRDLGLDEAQIERAMAALDTVLQGGSALNLGPVPDELASRLLLGLYRQSYAVGYAGGQLVAAVAFVVVGLCVWIWLRDDDEDDSGA